MSKSKSYRKSKSTSQLFGKGGDTKDEALSSADAEKIKRQIERAEDHGDTEAVKRLQSRLSNAVKSNENTTKEES